MDNFNFLIDNRSANQNNRQGQGVGQGHYNIENLYSGSIRGYQKPNGPANNEFINNFNPNQYVSKGPSNNQNTNTSSSPSKVFSNYFFNHPEGGQGNNSNNRGHNNGKSRLDGSDFIK